MIYKFLFPSKPNDTRSSLLLLAARIIIGLLFFSHGIQKWNNFSELSTVFPDPLGVGGSTSLGLAIFGELICSLAFIFGVLYRLSMLPMIFTMFMAFFVIHGGDSFSVRELAFLYLAIFILMYVAGPGKFSVDNFIAKMVSKRK
ncbi:DoxX family protein [Bacteroides sp. 224]|uniref:DoxX family protein n=1 Tax=Bacteroides sp. 224 TaxID=2302936 RepID=UPI0013D37B0E|nr:DoxX family protein [Bacteroides sp. 224]NDV64350.1 DoxX family protein [Bacteroides sp. 224]